MQLLRHHVDRHAIKLPFMRRQHLAEPDVIVEELRKDEAIAEADNPYQSDALTAWNNSETGPPRSRDDVHTFGSR